MDITRRTSDALKRNSSAISFVILVCFIAMALSTGYFILAYAPSEFLQRPEVQEYENLVGGVERMDEWVRTRYYWSHNLRVAGLYVITAPSYLSFHSSVYTGYSIGVATSYWYHGLGPNVALAFMAGIFAHGVLELTGVFIITGATLRAAWNFWKGMGYMASWCRKSRKTWSWGLSRRERKELRKHEGKIKCFLADFTILVGLGAFLIFLAGPIEAYVSPWVIQVFFMEPLIAVAFLATITLLYFSVFFGWLGGLRTLRSDIYQLCRDMGAAFKFRWRPTHLSLLMFAVFSIMMILLW